MSSNIRVHGSVEPDGDEFKITFEIAGLTARKQAQRINVEIAAVIHEYFRSLGGVPKEAGMGTPPWKVKQ